MPATIGYFMTGVFFYINLGLRQSEGTYEREDRLKLWTQYQKEYLEHSWSYEYMR